MNDREKELKRLLYLKSEVIRQAKKEMRELRLELDALNKQKTLERKKRNYKY